MSDVATVLEPLVRSALGPNPPVAVRCWDGTTLGPTDAPVTVVVNSPNALRRLLYQPNELGLGRAYVAGELEFEGDVYAVLGLRDRIAAPDEHAEIGIDRRAVLRAARELRLLRKPLPPPPEEARLSGRRHSKARDAAAIAHHYDVSNEFYRLILGETMTYSCAYFAGDDATLDEAQEAKYDHICRKLGLREGMRLLDVGCGWGGMVLHAARHYGVEAVGVTVSRHQHEYAAKRMADGGVADRVDIRLQDYRDIADGPFDAISSIGMFEHVGLARLKEYFTTLFGLLQPTGRLLNHAISRPPGNAAFDKRSFIERYVFPDGELHEAGTVVSAMQGQGFEVRDVESLREHYAHTLRHWVANLEADWETAVRLIGSARARVWRLYMAGSAVNFEAGRTSIHQVLAVKPGPGGDSGMPPTRAAWYA